MTTLAAWLHTIDPFALRISGEFGFRWYGLAYIAGFACAWWMLLTLAKRGAVRMRPERVTDAIFALVVGVLVGGRLGYIAFYEPSLLWTFFDAPPWWGLLAINRGGMASHGGILGVLAASWWIARREQAPLLHVTDCVALAAPLGLFFGRIANFINGELLGKIVAAPGEPAPWWSVKFPQEILSHHAPPLTEAQARQLDLLLLKALPNGSWPDTANKLVQRVQEGFLDFREQVAPLLAARHPSQLYQAAAEGIVVGVVVLLVWCRPRKPGAASAAFLLSYGALRIVTEFWRLPDDQFVEGGGDGRIAGLSRGQWLSAAMVIVGALLLWWSQTRNRERMGGLGAKRNGAPARWHTE